MTPTINTHVSLLQEQLSCLFRFVNDRRVHRTAFNRFKPMSLESDGSVSYKHEDYGSGRSSVIVTVDTVNREFQFQQNYNFGVLLGLQVRVSNVKDKQTKWLLDEYINRMDADEADIKETLIDFEYAISVTTENMASNLVSVGS